MVKKVTTSEEILIYNYFHQGGFLPSGLLAGLHTKYWVDVNSA